MNFCRLPPDRLCALARTPLALTLKVSTMPRAKAARALAVDQAAAHRPQRWPVRSAFSVSDMRRHRAAAEPLFRHEGQAEARRRPGRAGRRPCRRCGSPRGRGAASRRESADSSSCLAVARDAGDADDLAAVHIEGDVAERRCRMIVGRAADKPATRSTGRSLRPTARPACPAAREPTIMRARSTRLSPGRVAVPVPGRCAARSRCRKAAGPRRACG